MQQWPTVQQLRALTAAIYESRWREWVKAAPRRHWHARFRAASRRAEQEARRRLSAGLN